MTHLKTLTRRTALTHSLKIASVGAFAAVTPHGFSTQAQDATPGTGGAGGGVLAGLGLPELNITISDTGYEGLDSQLAAGRYLVNATYTGSGSGTAQFMQLPEGMTLNDLMTMLGGGAAASPAAGGDMASPAPEAALASPVAEGGEDQGPPEWYYTVDIPGGVGLGPGQAASFIITLRPGTYILWAEDPSAPQQPVELTVTGEVATPAAAVAFEADVTITEIATDDGFAFELDGQFTGASQVVSVANQSDQPHFIFFAALPEGATREDVDALFQSFMTGTPAAGGLGEEDIQPVYTIGTQSADTTQWHELTLAAGSYLIACFIPDIARGGIPHAFEGMYDVITVGA